MFNIAHCSCLYNTKLQFHSIRLSVVGSRSSVVAIFQQSCPMNSFSFNCCIFFIFHCILCFIYYSINRMEDSPFLTRSKMSNMSTSWNVARFWQLLTLLLRPKHTTAFRRYSVHILLNWCFLPFYMRLCRCPFIISAIQLLFGFFDRIAKRYGSTRRCHCFSFIFQKCSLFIFVRFFNHFPFIIIFHICAMPRYCPFFAWKPISHVLISLHSRSACSKFSNHNRYAHWRRVGNIIHFLSIHCYFVVRLPLIIG